jgi:phosphoserine phosphatase RsbU/P
MPRVGLSGKVPELKPDHILELGAQLASIGDYPKQKHHLEQFLEQYFSGKAYIWLRSPHKSLTINLKKTAFPFDPDSDPPGQAMMPYQIQPDQTKSEFWCIIPLMHRENIFGKMIVFREQAFHEQEQTLLDNISKVAGLALCATLQAHLHDWRQKKLALVRSVNARISQITDLEVLTREIVHLIQETFNYYYVAIFLVHESSGRLRFEASSGSVEGDRPEFEQNQHPGFQMGEHIIGHVAKTGAELIANDVRKEPRYQAVGSLKATRAEVVLPLKVETRVFGVLDVQADTKNAFDEDDLLVLRALADNIAIAIESTYLFEGIQRRAEQLAVVSDVSRSITHILDIDELLQRIVNLIHERFQIPYVHFYTVDRLHNLISFKAGSGTRTHLYADAGISFDIHAQKGILPWVVQTGQTKRVSDVRKEPLYLEVPLSPTIVGSEMVVPLAFGDEILGVLDLQSNEINAFSSDDQQLMETLADNLAIAIRNARLYRSEKWRRQVAESLRDIAGLLSDNSALADVLEAILEQLHKNLPCDVAGIWLFEANQPDAFEPQQRLLSLSAWKTAEPFSSYDFQGLAHLPDEWVFSTLAQKEPGIRQLDDPKGPIAELLGFDNSYSAIAAPLSTGDEVLGILTLIHHAPGRYGSESQRITSAFASYAAIAIKNTRLYTQAQEQAWISTILLQVANAIQSLTDLNELGKTIVRLTPLVVGVKGCALLLRVPESKVFQLSAMYGIVDLIEDEKHNLPLSLPAPPILEEILSTHEPYQISDPKEDLNLPDDLAEQFSKHVLILYPLLARNEVLGAFLLANEPDPDQNNHPLDLLSEDRYKIVQGIMQQTAIAVENIRLFEARQEEAYISAVLLQAAQATVSSADLQDTLDSMVNIMPILVGIDSSVIYLWDDQEQAYLTAYGTTKTVAETEGLIGTKYHPGDFPMLDGVFRNNRPMVYPFIDTVLSPEDWDLALPDEGLIDPAPILQTQYPLLMGFPLSVKEDIYGVLLAEDDNFSTNRERRFELLWGIAQQASLAIQNDLLNKEMLDRQRLEREFQLAREIQQTFLPNQFPDTPGWEMDVRWETARQVGGDFYDYFLLPDGRLAIVIADVSDKGLAASLYMAVTRTLLRAAALESNSPARTLEHVNDLLLDNSQNGLFVTTFYGILGLDAGLLSYTIAGHNPPFVIRNQNNDVLMLNKGGIALGALPDIQLPEHEIVLNPGDCLVLYTDGVTEAFNHHDQMYGDDRLMHVLHAQIGNKAQRVLEAIEADLTAFRDGAPLSDDTTTLAICRA